MEETNKCEPQESCCCACASEPDQPWVTGSIDTPVGPVPLVATQLSLADTLGTWKARWGIGRMNFKVPPGLYGVGQPDAMSPVLVTANYKMSFDRLRVELSGIDAWVLVLDTKGINVWCAAGKGTFGTAELVARMAQVNLSGIVSHRTVVLPQLSAPGVAAHEVRKSSEFRVVYGPVRASDVPAFLAAGMKADAGMRQVRFSFYDRLVLAPIELVGTLKLSLMIFGVLFIVNLLREGFFGLVDFIGYVGALLVGCFFVPILLPWIPGKAFAWKGWLLGMLWAAGVTVLGGWPPASGYVWLRAGAYLLILPAISAYYAMNFTGCSTYTSFSGVMKEMKFAVPAIAVSIGLGLVLLLAAVFIPGGR